MKDAINTTYLTQCLTVIAVIAVVQPAIAADPAEQELIDILQSDAAREGQSRSPARNSRWLAAKDSTEALGKLLPDPELSSWARIALGSNH